MDTQTLFEVLTDGALFALMLDGARMKDKRFVRDAMNELARRYGKAVRSNGETIGLCYVAPVRRSTTP